MPEKAPFKTGRIHGFSNRNAADDAEAVQRFCKRNSAKIRGLDRKVAFPTNRRNHGCKTELFLEKFADCLPFSPNVVFLSLPRSFTAASPRSLPAGEVFARSYPIRTVIQFSICPSIGSQREGPKIKPVCKFFELCLQRQKEPVHSTPNQREMISRSIFDETMYRLYYSETFNVCYFRSAGRLSNRSGAAVISFDGCLEFHFRYSVVDSAMRVKYSIAYGTLVRQVVWSYAVKNLKIFQKQ